MAHTHGHHAHHDHVNGAGVRGLVRGLVLDGASRVTQAHGIAEAAHHRLLHKLTNPSDAIIHVDPEGTCGDPHAATRHHADSQRFAGS